MDLLPGCQTLTAADCLSVAADPVGAVRMCEEPRFVRHSALRSITTRRHRDVLIASHWPAITGIEFLGQPALTFLGVLRRGRTKLHL